MKRGILEQRQLRNVFISTALFAVVCESALARSSKREGLNFGAGLRLAESQEGTEGTDSSFDLKRQTSSTMISPHIGFAFAEHFDLGLSVLVETSENVDSTTGTDNSSKLEKKTTTELNGTSLYYRFLFADVMFFEIAGGYYTAKSSITENIKGSETSGSYVGSENRYKLESQGFGYHFGAGIDVEVGNGFFIRGSYIGRKVLLKNLGSAGNIGKSTSTISRQEAQFGIVHFVN